MQRQVTGVLLARSMFRTAYNSPGCRLNTIAIVCHAYNALAALDEGCGSGYTTDATVYAAGQSPAGRVEMSENIARVSVQTV
ncbi:MAG: hypothetical protein R3E74_11135 [Pseudomonadales bacterium]